MISTTYYIICFYVFYSLSACLFIVFFNKIFYRKRIKVFICFLIIYILSYFVFLTLSMKYGQISDSFFAIIPIYSLVFFKFSNLLFLKIFKEELIDTTNFFQYEIPKLNNIWTHRIYNAIFINLSVMLPIFFLFYYRKVPSKQFIETMAKILLTYTN